MAGVIRRCTGVKVIIQDLKSRHYLSPTGQWVADREDAGDFHTLLHAYHFARNNTNRSFHVLLYCPDDQFCSSIISGTGITAVEAMPASTKAVVKPQRVKAFKAVRRPQLGTDFNAGLDGSRFYLN
jgi:hypothetical protein